MPDPSDIFALFGLLFIVGFANVCWWGLRAEKRAALAQIAAGADDQCQLCRATGLKFQNETAGDYRCLECGFDTELRQREDLAGYLGALRLVDAACAKLDKARQAAEMQGRNTSLFTSREGAGGQNKLKGAQNDLLGGLAELKQMVEEFAPIVGATTLEDGSTISDAIYAVLARAAGDRPPSKSAKDSLPHRLIEQDAIATLSICKGARAELARPVEQAIEAAEAAKKNR